MMGMMGNDRKKLATLIVGSMGPMGDGMKKEVDPNGEDNSYNEMDAVAEEMIDAINKKDVSSLSACLKGLMYKFSAGLSKNAVEQEEMED